MIHTHIHHDALLAPPYYVVGADKENIVADEDSDIEGGGWRKGKRYGTSHPQRKGEGRKDQEGPTPPERSPWASGHGPLLGERVPWSSASLFGSVTPHRLPPPHAMLYHAMSSQRIYHEECGERCPFRSRLAGFGEHRELPGEVRVKLRRRRKNNSVHYMSWGSITEIFGFCLTSLHFRRSLRVRPDAPMFLTREPSGLLKQDFLTGWM